MVEGSLAISDSDNLTVRGRGILFNPHPSEGKGHSPLNIRTSSNVRLEGIVLLDRADSWTLRVVASRGVTIENFHLLSEIRDGLDIINSQAVTVRDSFFMTHDDAICLKGLAEGQNQPVEDVLVERCVIANMGGGTGSGAAPVITRIAREEGAFVVVFATMPCGHSMPKRLISLYSTGVPADFRFRGGGYIPVLAGFRWPPGAFEGSAGGGIDRRWGR